MSGTHPAMRYDRRGDAYIDFPPELTETPVATLYRAALTANLPAATYDWEPDLGTLWVGWHAAREVERRLRAMWPDAAVTAEANPHYGQRAAQIMEAYR